MTDKSPENFDLLGALISQEFTECSITAAEVNKLVAERLEDRLPKADLVTIGPDYNYPRPYRVLDLAGSLHTDQEEATLALLEPAHKPRRMGWLRHVVEPPQHDAIQTDPLLVARVGDTMFPIASFAKRESGVCSYVQIGAEMRDDNSLFVTTADEHTSRYDVVEAIRAVIGGKVAAGDGSRASHIIQELLNSERGYVSPYWEQAKEARLVRQVYEPKDYSKNKRLYVLHESDVPGVESIGLNNFSSIDKVHLASGRDITIQLGEANGTLSLYAQTRNELLLPLVTFNRDIGTITFVQGEPAVEVKQTVLGLLSEIVKQKTPRHEYSGKADRSKEYQHNLIPAPDELRYDPWDLAGDMHDRIISKYCCEKGWLDKRTECYFPPLIGPELERMIYSLLDEFLKNPESENPFPNSKPLRLAHYRLNPSEITPAATDVDLTIREGGQLNSLVNALNVESSLESIMGSTTIDEEKLINRIYAMWKQSPHYSGLAKNRAIGKAIGDARVNVDIQREGTNFSLRISARPEAQAGEPFRILINHELDITQPLFTKGHQPADRRQRSQDILEILNSLQFSLRYKAKSF